MTKPKTFSWDEFKTKITVEDKLSKIMWVFKVINTRGEESSL